MTDKKTKPQGTNGMTPIGRVSYPNIDKPRYNELSKKTEYSMVLLFKKDDPELPKLAALVRQAIVQKWGADEDKWPPNIKKPFKDGDAKADADGYKGCYYVNLKSEIQPGLVDQNMKPIISFKPGDPGSFYAGCYARADVNASAYEVTNNRGVSLWLNNIQKARDGQPFSGRKAAEDVFTEIADDSGADNAANYAGSGKKSDMFS